MSDANVATIKTIYEAFGTGDVPTILDVLTDDVDWAADTASTAAPWYGQRVGKDAVAGFFSAISEPWTSPSSPRARSHRTTPRASRSSTSASP